MLLVIDNYDSFTYNLVQYFGELGAVPTVIKNDEMTVDEIDEHFTPTAIVISPGPGTPDDAGISFDVLKRFAGDVPILGVCLGHQAIAEYFGGKVIKAPRPVHGKECIIETDGRTLFPDIPKRFSVGRYHSLIVEKVSLPDCLEVSAITDDGIIMALRHKDMAVEGVQFHPESVLTEHGKTLLKNFLDRKTK